jgi:hypothetical protein
MLASFNKTEERIEPVLVNPSTNLPSHSQTIASTSSEAKTEQQEPLETDMSLILKRLTKLERNQKRRRQPEQRSIVQRSSQYPQPMKYQNSV